MPRDSVLKGCAQAQLKPDAGFDGDSPTTAPGTSESLRSSEAICENPAAQNGTFEAATCLSERVRNRPGRDLVARGEVNRVVINPDQIDSSGHTEPCKSVLLDKLPNNGPTGAYTLSVTRNPVKPLMALNWTSPA